MMRNTMFGGPFEFFDTLDTIVEQLFAAQGKQYITSDIAETIAEWFTEQWKNNDPQQKFIDKTQAKVWKILTDTLEERYPSSTMNKMMNTEIPSKNIERLNKGFLNVTYDLHDPDKKWNNRRLTNLLGEFAFPSEEKMPVVVCADGRYFSLKLNLEHLQEDVIKLHSAVEEHRIATENLYRSVYAMLKDYSTLGELYVDFPELKKVDLTPQKKKDNVDKLRALIIPAKKKKGKKKNV